MATDDERREVARRLRELRGGWSSGECYYAIIHALELPDTSREDGGHALYGALADLIEPRCDRERLLAIATMMAANSVRSAKQGISVSPVYTLHAARNVAEACGETFGSIRNRELAKWGTSIVPKETIVDRDALLALADNLDSSAGMLLKQNDLDPNRKRRGMRRDHAKSLMAASDRIREACGEVSDGE